MNIRPDFIENIERMVNKQLLDDGKSGYILTFMKEDNPLRTIMNGKLTFTLIKTRDDGHV